MRTSKNVIVVGGGIGGLTAALDLTRATCAPGDRGRSGAAWFLREVKTGVGAFDRLVE